MMLKNNAIFFIISFININPCCEVENINNYVNNVKKENNDNDRDEKNINDSVDKFVNGDVEDKNKYNEVEIDNKNKEYSQFDLNRFIEAQKNDYNIALNEIKNGQKETHWIWYIFPQIKDLGVSEISKKYSIKTLEEGLEYLRNDTLRRRLIEITRALVEYYAKDNVKKIEKIFIYPDYMKLHSSMTLFLYILGKYKNGELKSVYDEFLYDGDIIFSKVLNIYFSGQKDKKTLEIIKKISTAS